MGSPVDLDQKFFPYCSKIRYVCTLMSTSTHLHHPRAGLPQVVTPPGYAFRDVQLEMSLKPFYDTTPETRDAVITEIFYQWHALTRHAESISIMFWIGDGSEILEYDGDMAREFEWGRYHGSANPHKWKLPNKKKEDDSDRAAIGVNIEARDPEKKGLHSRSYIYRENPARFSYNWLRDTVAAFKKIGQQITGKKILVGETFDIGPEFAVSRFKYDWHREILCQGGLFAGQFITCEAVLEPDSRKYAGFPSGIPAGTTMGRFLGRQTRHLLEDCGFDFLWLSNGFGFALEPWGLIGNVFDGAKYFPEMAAKTSENILRFWREMREELPLKYRIRTRGTNLSTGVDLASDASPLAGIYDGNFGVDAPVNSPWAALDGDFGIELAGWMSHMCVHPGETFRFRYYTHDAWWMNSPYLDRYERNPHDIYLPLSVSRVTESGAIEIPRDIAFLSIDDSHGQMPLAVPNEVTAHILRAREFAPDTAGPVIWIYPFKEYHRMALVAKQPEWVMHGDWFVRGAIANGVPVNTVADADVFAQAVQADPAITRGRILLSPVPQPGSADEKLLFGLFEKGANLLLYGPIAEGSRFLEPLGLKLAEPLEGDFELQLEQIPDGETVHGRTLRHLSFISGGAYREAASSEKVVHSAIARQGVHTRVAATSAQHPSGGKLAWVRGSLATDEYDPEDPSPINGPLLRPMDPEKFFPSERLARFMLENFGWRISVTTETAAQRRPYMTAHRHRNAVMLSGYNPDEATILRVRHPLGAPLLLGRHNRIVHGATEISGEIAWQREVRVFVESGGDAVVRCKIDCPVMHGVYRRMTIFGTTNSRVNFLVDPGSDKPIRILRDALFPYFQGNFVEPKITQTEWGPVISVDNVTGWTLFEW